jgi:hypothetical protein
VRNLTLHEGVESVGGEPVMNKHTRKKLRLGKETLRSMGREELGHVAGASYICLSALLKCTAKCGTGGVSKTTCLTCDTDTTETTSP